MIRISQYDGKPNRGRSAHPGRPCATSRARTAARRPAGLAGTRDEDRQRCRRRSRIERWCLDTGHLSAGRGRFTALAALLAVWTAGAGADRPTSHGSRRSAASPVSSPKLHRSGRAVGPTGSWLARARSARCARSLRQPVRSLPEAAPPSGRAIAPPDRRSWPTDRDRLGVSPWHSPAESPARFPRSRTPADVARWRGPA
jgi:hypothetical protein